MARWSKMFDWRLTARSHVDFYGRVGGNVPSVEELRAQVDKHIPTPLDVFATQGSTRSWRVAMATDQ